MASDVHRLPPGGGLQAAAVDLHFEARKQLVAGGHAVDQRVQPVDQQQLRIGRGAVDPRRLPWRDGGRIADRGGQGQRRTGERLLQRGAGAAHADVGFVGEGFVGHVNGLVSVSLHRLAGWQKTFLFSWL